MRDVLTNIAPDGLVCSTGDDISTIFPHVDFGDPTCNGCLSGEVQGDVGVISCNECGAKVRKLPASELQRMLDEMESELDLATHDVRIVERRIFDRVLIGSRVRVCDRCGKSNEVAE